IVEGQRKAPHDDNHNGPSPGNDQHHVDDVCPPDNDDNRWAVLPDDDIDVPFDHNITGTRVRRLHHNHGCPIGGSRSAGGGRRAGVVDGQTGLLVVAGDPAGGVGGGGDAGEVPAHVEVLGPEVGELRPLGGVGLGGEGPEELAVEVEGGQVVRPVLVAEVARDRLVGAGRCGTDVLGAGRHVTKMADQDDLGGSGDDTGGVSVDLDLPQR